MLVRWRLGVRTGPATDGPPLRWVREIIAGLVGLVVVVLGLEADGGRAVPTVDGGLGRTVPGGRPRAVPVVEEVVVGRETGGLLLACERG